MQNIKVRNDMIFHVHDSWAGENPGILPQRLTNNSNQKWNRNIKEISIKITWFLVFWSNDGKCESEKCTN